MLGGLLKDLQNFRRVLQLALKIRNDPVPQQRTQGRTAGKEDDALSDLFQLVDRTVERGAGADDDGDLVTLRALHAAEQPQGTRRKISRHIAGHLQFILEEAALRKHVVRVSEKLLARFGE